MFKSMILAVAVLGLTACGSDDSEQSAECKKYLACIKATTPEFQATAEVTYGADGSCWNSDETARVCTAACTDGLTQLRGHHPDESACK
ncbi:putative lipoprotein [Myxococcus xanthus DK 1622]|uniref:Lipoprotein n=1 Tax=Myxococcus xanthus (strain DK1622) TaxID=246197 RepID=Q1D1D6_MYXXD|nr:MULTISPECIES: hypothetical protein [Myxococcus]ABF87573.1 putative lipoprotein [Myxococcus xanthus DK 1622]NOJ54780.1 hypothetical protein [Myxococcus xanthus]QPM77854.1 hypothetical protein I5Q59_26635 [Myxococcus xanthus]QVW66922.1 hypothetical protein JTM82_31985 [Myxococcus xanthus DZ2]UEO06950.1 hypothetical protein K1515_10810 [Myxococcus xanthus DZ2]